MYSIEAEYPLFLCLQLEAIDLFAVFEYNEHVSVLSFSFRVFFKKSQKNLQRLEQFAISQAMYSSEIIRWRWENNNGM